ncbi:hypothetical protein ABFT80_23630 [Mesorhizobium sp. SB112]|uniref:hypothetical protein n=1 Tax=Mesorhizobium sp. SB112 TaxID=3151853 RepID=UPI003262E35B
MTSIEQLRLKRVPINTRLRREQTAELIAITMALQSGLRTTLEHLAAANGFQDGPWLTEIEKTLVEDASNLWSEGIAIETELNAMSSGRNLIRTLTEALRMQLRAMD